MSAPAENRTIFDESFGLRRLGISDVVSFLVDQLLFPQEHYTFLR